MDESARAKPLGFWGLAATAKLVRAEMQDLFLEECVFSIQPSDATSWLGWLEQHAQKQLSSITKVTLVSLDQRSHAPSSETLRALVDMLPDLNGVGYQCQTPRYSPVANNAGSGDAELGLGRWWSNWGPVASLENFAPKVTIAVEGMLLLEEEYVKDTESGIHHRIRERQGILRVIRDGKERGYEGTGWENSDVRLEAVQPRELTCATDEVRAGWRQWWKAAGLRRFAAKVGE